MSKEDMTGRYGYAQLPDGNEIEGEVTGQRFGKTTAHPDEDQSNGRLLPDYIEIDGVQIPPHWVIVDD